jgi:hypothetical protein
LVLLTIYKEIQGLADPSPAAVPQPVAFPGRNFPEPPAKPLPPGLSGLLHLKHELEMFPVTG